jgi:TusA-related sulfurtransferase
MALIRSGTGIHAERADPIFGAEQEPRTAMDVHQAPDLTLDLTGLPNPEPILRLSEAATNWRPGDTVRVLADDECFVSDFLRWSVGSELDLLELRYPPGGQTELTVHVPRTAHRLSA